MNAVVAGLAAALGIGGIFLVIAGLKKAPRLVTARPKTGRLNRWWAGLSSSRRVYLVAVAVVAVAIFSLTKWVAALMIIPFAGYALPALLANQRNHSIELLEALDRWVRALAASISTGKSLADAIRSTVGQTPALLAPSVRRLVSRLDERWHLREALLALAEELNSSDSDAVLAALVIASDRGGVGAIDTLTALSDNVQHRLIAAREIEAERAKPRIVVRQVTVITIAMVGIFLVIGRSYFTPFATPLGQVIVVILTISYFGSLLGLRRQSAPRPHERILRAGVSSGSVVDHA